MSEFKMCSECVEEWMKWLDYKQPVPFAIHVVKRDPNAQVERWKQTITSQQALIRKHCESKHQEG